ncbi:MAG: hypothetical protein GY749_23590 [Desulfobacteraceae bacterium]|nr:hypothetical protein [Desulfobacteraceae bacterium]
MPDIRESLRNELSALKNARDVLCYSYEKCARIGVKLDLTYEELESFEALTSRFARLSDIIIQKIFRLFDILELEDHGTVRDRINRAEKREAVKSADDFIQIRILRNEIAHEYKPETFYEIFEQVMDKTPTLLKSVDKIINYSEKYF